MLRNDLINMMANQDNDNVTVNVNGHLVDIEAISTQDGDIIVHLDPTGANRAFDILSRPPTGFDTGLLAKNFNYLDVMLSHELIQDLREDGDADVTVDMGGTVIDVFRVSYDPRRERFILYCHPDDVAEVLQKPA